jgi:methylmalonyl-CoA mutase
MDGTDLTGVGAFPPATRARWREMVEAALKGTDFDRRLVGRSRDGLRIEPLYEAAEAAPQPGRATPGPWRVAQRVDHPDPAEANALVLLDLEGGAGALDLVVAGARSARGFGLAPDADALDRALAGVVLPIVQLRLDAGAAAEAAAEALLALAARRGHALGELDLDLGLDPLGALATTGRIDAGWEASAAARLADLDARGFRGLAFRADGRPFHEAGAGEAQELAAVLAAGVATLRALENGHPLDRARGAIGFRLAADADVFLTVAKFRAFRRLWARVEAACGLEPAPARLDAETAWRMTTRRDPWVNLLRGTVAAFAAGLGGADAVTVLPFTTALGLPDAFARRLARNAQWVLLEEAHLGRVADPAAGAGGFESLTEQLCEAAWAEFQAIEAEGGLARSLAAGALQARIAAVAAARARDVATRREPITGTSEFPHLAEAPVAVLPVAPVPPPAAGPSALPSHRLAEPFERLRDAAEARPGGARAVFLANLGPVAAFTARATFAKNAFEAGGLPAPVDDGASTPEAVAAAFRASGARQACLCSSDAVYAEWGDAAARALRGAGAEKVWLAGRPGEAEAAWRAAGVTGFVYAGCDLLAVLEEAQAA